MYQAVLYGGVVVHLVVFIKFVFFFAFLSVLFVRIYSKHLYCRYFQAAGDV